MLKDILLAAEPALTTLLQALLVAAVAAATRYLMQKSKSQKLDDILFRAGDAITTLVRAQAQVLDQARGDDGRLSAEEARLAKASVVALFKSMWGKKGLEELAKILGFTDDPDGAKVDDWIAAKVEGAVRTDKRAEG